MKNTGKLKTRKDIFEAQLKSLQTDIASLSEKMSARGDKALDKSSAERPDERFKNLNEAVAHWKEEAARLKAELISVSKEKDEAIDKFNMLEKEHEEYKRSYQENKALKAVCERLKQDVESLKITLESSERIRKQQKELIVLLQKSHTAADNCSIASLETALSSIHPINSSGILSIDPANKLPMKNSEFVGLSSNKAKLDQSLSAQSMNSWISDQNNSRMVSENISWLQSSPLAEPRPRSQSAEPTRRNSTTSQDKRPSTGKTKGKKPPVDSQTKNSTPIVGSTHTSTSKSKLTKGSSSKTHHKQGVRSSSVNSLTRNSEHVSSSNDKIQLSRSSSSRGGVVVEGKERLDSHNSSLHSHSSVRLSTPKPSTTIDYSAGKRPPRYPHR